MIDIIIGGSYFALACFILSPFISVNGSLIFFSGGVMAFIARVAYVNIL